MATAFLSLGSNLGEREENIRTAIQRLERTAGIGVSKVSSLYLTAPVGYTDQSDFVNAVAQIYTELEPADLLRAILGIEQEMGRVRNLRWGPRVIDIDILTYDDETIRGPGLVIPHPRMLERAFVLAPLAEIAPDLRLGDGRTAREVLEGLQGQMVCRIPEVP